MSKNPTNWLDLLQGQPPEEGAGLFGADLSPDEAQLVLLPVPWDGTASYGKGAAKAPEAVLGASHQLDLYDADFGMPVRCGIILDEVDSEIASLCSNAKTHDQISEVGPVVNHWVRARSVHYLAQKKFVAVLGGDHSVPLGLMQALSQYHLDYGVLHLDAHHDLRDAYEGYKYSHASIFFNALKEIPEISKLVSVGIRDYSKGEADFANSCGERVLCFYDAAMQREMFEGEKFASIAQRIVNSLPTKVYVSMDIDGLDPTLCPGTGTPVAGGLSFAQFAYILNLVVQSGRSIIGFDLCEVAPQEGDAEWNANVGARALYKLCGALLRSQNLEEKFG